MMSFLPFEFFHLSLLLLFFVGGVSASSAPSELITPSLRGQPDDSNDEVDCIENPDHGDCQQRVVVEEEHRRPLLLGLGATADFGIGGGILAHYLVDPPGEDPCFGSLTADMTGTNETQFRYVLKGGAVLRSSSWVFPGRYFDATTGNLLWEFRFEFEFNEEGDNEIIFKRGWVQHHKWEEPHEEQGIEAKEDPFRSSDHHRLDLEQLYVDAGTEILRSASYFYGIGDEDSCILHRGHSTRGGGGFHNDCLAKAELEITGRPTDTIAAFEFSLDADHVTTDWEMARARFPYPKSLVVR